MMNQNNVLKLIVCSLMSLIFIACNNQKTPTFIVEGTILGAENKTLYLQDRVNNILDSTVLTAKGNFSFQENSPAYTRFYDLRLGEQFIHFVVDSVETIEIKVDDAKYFARDYSITGLPENQQIKELTIMQMNLGINYHNLREQYQCQEIDQDSYIQTLDQYIKEYKDNAIQYISSSFSSPVAIFALLQQVNQMLIFSPYNEDDLRFYGAVANNYPDSVYREQIKQMYLQGMADKNRKEKQDKEIELEEADGKTWFEIKLPSNEGQEVSLSELGDNKITLADFSAYSLEESPARNFVLAELYAKYHDKGFEIYQISLDNDEHFWLNAADNLPWTTVRDQRTLYSDYLNVYNVLYVPTSFLRDRNGDIVERIDNLENLEQIIKKYIK